MRIYITENDVDAYFSLDWSEYDDATRVLRKANLWLNRRLVGVPDPTPEDITIAGAELCLAIVKGNIYGEQGRETLSEEVSAESGTHIKETFKSGSKEMSAEEAYIIDLISPWVRKTGVSFQFLART